ncbi:hypothetical protein FRB94_008837 [Tulasnella sp. JGI-2019a]|nr:hypothetical protein FRB94_008837 [Tulasnella sp. JGI-2019a]
MDSPTLVETDPGERAVSFSEFALDLGRGNPSRAPSLINLIVGLWKRFAAILFLMNTPRTNISLLKGTIRRPTTVLRPNTTIPAVADSDPELRALSLVRFAIGCQERFEQTKDRSELDNAIKYFEQGLNLLDERHPARVGALCIMGTCLSMRFQDNSDRRELDRSIACLQEVLKLLHKGHSLTPMSLDILAGDLLTRFEQNGDRGDLDQSVSYYREALDLLPEGHPNRSESLSNLANGLLTRFEQNGDRGDLDQSVNYYREALDLRPEGHPGSLSNLASGLLRCFEQNGDRGDLDQSVSYYIEALDLLPEGHPNRSGSLSNLANVLLTRFGQNGDRGDLDQSVNYYRESLDLLSEGHPNRSGSLSNLANVLLTRFGQNGDRGELDQSVNYCREALDLLPEGHPNRSVSLSNLANGLLRRFEQDRDMNGLVLSLSLARDGAIHESSSVTHRFRASLTWVNIGRITHHPSVMEAYATSISLLDLHTTFARSIGTQHSRLRDHFSSPHTRGLASDAASYALQESSPEKAVEFLEQGRSILYSQLGNYRTSLADLDSFNPGLAGLFRVRSARLEASVTSYNDEHISFKTDDVVAWYQHAAAEWAQGVKLIRKVPGFSSFLKRKPFQELQLAASHGPVVIVNISQFRSDAIVVQHTGLPAVIPLPDAHLEDLDSLSGRLSGLVLRQDGDTENISQAVAEVLREIWKAIVEPIATHLEHKLGLAHGSRLWWMPTSKACSLPLHAAGPYVKGQKNMSDRFISSYTPTLSILLRSIAHTEAYGLVLERMIAPHFLLVAQGNAQGQRPLESVSKETNIIQSSPPQVVTLDGKACTRANVLDGLKDAEWVHLACHGHRNQREPFKSYFSLHKETDALTLLDIIKHARPKAELAVSFCSR